MSASYRFGRFELRPASRQLLIDGQSAALGARAFDVLHALVDRRERLVTKDELLAAVWPGLVVEENNLEVHISALRKVLGPQAIATIPRRGYRFTLEADDAAVVKPCVPAAPVHNLPQPLTRFVGREREVADCSRLLEQARLLTLTGIGGSGKTRLAIKLANLALPSFPDGVWFVDLAPLKDSERVDLSVATTLRLKETPETPLVDALREYLATKRCLLVLDNCEHLLGAVAMLVRELLAAGGALKLLVTSREGLGIDGERLFAVRSLSLPPAEDVGAVEASEAGQLFLDRAQLADAEFALDAKSAPAVAEICRRLDGIPLALELAAARLQLLSVGEIRERLDDRFRLLAGGKKAALGRHETLRATIQWSYEQLDPEAQRLFRALSVFAGGCTLHGAMAVWGPGADEFPVLEVLTRLSDKSLIETERVRSGPTRYAMLETVREFAQELLQAADEMHAVRTRHLDHYLALAGVAEQKLRGPEQGEWLARLEREHENLMAAHRWCDEAECGAAKGLQLAGRGLSRYWFFSGHPVLGLRVHLEALGRAGADKVTVERACVLLNASRDFYLFGDSSAARTHAEESLAISRALGHRRYTSHALGMLAGIAARDAPLEAIALFDEAITIDRESGDLQSLAGNLADRGETFRFMGSLDRARADDLEALALMRETGDLNNVATTLCNLAAIDIDLGNLGTARERLIEGMKLVIDTGDKSIRQDFVEVGGALTIAFGDAVRAAQAFGVAQAIREDVRIPREYVNEQFIQPWIARTRVALGEAAFELAFAAGRALPHEDAIAETLTWLERYQEPGGAGNPASC